MRTQAPPAVGSLARPLGDALPFLVPRRWAPLVGWSHSLALHTLVLLVLACVGFTTSQIQQAFPASTVIAVEAGQPGEDTSIDLSLHPDGKLAGGEAAGSRLDRLEQQLSASVEVAQSRPHTPLLSPSLQSSQSSLLQGDPWQDGADGALDGVSTSRFSAFGEGGRGGSGGGAGASSGDGDGNGFFGSSREQARRIVYIVDNSGSMNAIDVGQRGSRFQRVQYELSRALGALEPQQEFYVLFFGQSTLAMPAPGLVSATKENLTKCGQWASQVLPNSNGTDPREALIMALALRPELIYLLTDGDFEPHIEKDLLDLKQSAVSIQTIAIGNRKGAKVLKRLALHNSGEYRFVE